MPFKISVLVFGVLAVVLFALGVIIIIGSIELITAFRYLSFPVHDRFETKSHVSEGIGFTAFCITIPYILLHFQYSKHIALAL